MRSYSVFALFPTTCYLAKNEVRMCCRFSVSKLPFIPEYWHPKLMVWLTGKLSVNQNLNLRVDVVLLSYMYMFTKLKQNAEQQTAVEQSPSEKRIEILKLQWLYITWTRKFFWNSDATRVDNLQYQVICLMVVGILKAQDSILNTF